MNKYIDVIVIISSGVGYKGIPGKNIMDFYRKQQLAWSILQASQAKAVTKMYATR
jgi:CMP-N-acetylneuraminic acid synthetase